MNKVIHEYYYIVGCSDFKNRYDLIVDRETEKMLYGTAYLWGVQSSGGSRFSVKKEDLNKVHEITGNRNGLVYRIQVEGDDYEETKKKAKKIVYDYIIDIAERFKNYKED
jgi:hypothetical protein